MIVVGMPEKDGCRARDVGRRKAERSVTAASIKIRVEKEYLPSIGHFEVGVAQPSQDKKISIARHRTAG